MSVSSTNLVSKPWLWHVIALMVVAVWGSTLASTKLLLATMTPSQILLYRSVLAWGLLWVMSPRLKTWHNVKTEALYITAGLCGITLYFVCENTALIYTYSSNAALLVTASPLFTVLIASFVFKTHAFTKTLLAACLVALIGVGLVLASQPMNLSQGMLGNGLALLGGLVWAFFGFAMATINDDCKAVVRMRKVFGYGIITTILYMALTEQRFINHAMLTSTNLLHLVYLGGVASALCFVLWG